MPSDTGKTFIEKQLAQKEKSNEPNVDVGAFERKLEALKRAYEQYFAGTLKVEPLRERDVMARQVLEYSNAKLKSAATTFKLQSLIAKYNSYAQMWSRQIQAIEQGRDRRDLFRLHLKEKTVPEKEKTGSVTESKSAGERSGDSISALYLKYVEAIRANQPNSAIPDEEAFRKRIQNETKSIGEKFGAKKITFGITVTNGKVQLKAKPKQDAS